MDWGTGTCDGAGHCVVCMTDTDCPSGMACVAGGCFLEPAPAGPLVTGLPNPWYLALDATYVYVSAGDSPNGEIVRVPIAGGPLSVVAPSQEEPQGLVVTGGTLYWVTRYGDMLSQMPVGGGSATTIAATGTWPQFLAIQGNTAIWASDFQVNAVALGGGTPDMLVSGTVLGVFANDATYVYWSDGSTIQKVPIAGGSSTPVVTGQTNIVSLGVDASSVYFATRGGALMKADLTTGTPTQLAPYGGPPPNSFTAASDLVVDGANLYWSDGYSVRRVPTAGGASTLLASGQHYVSSLVVDGTYVYWSVEAEGAVWKVPK
jgi:hypothetical protein